MKKNYKNVEHSTKRQKAVTGRAYCGLHTFTGGFREPVEVTVRKIRPKGVFS